MLTFLLFLMSWTDAASLSPSKPIRPAPIEPDLAVRMPSPKIQDPWVSDKDGYFWAKRPDGSFVGDKVKAILLPWGKPCSPPK